MIGWRTLAAAGLLAASFAAGWGVNGWRMAGALQALKTEQARQLTKREEIARRAIATARNQERDDVNAMAALAADYQAQAGRLAGDAAAVRGRLRDAIAAARASGMPTTCASTAGTDRAADPFEILGEAGSRILGIGDEADALSLRAEKLRAVITGDRADKP